MGTNWALIGQYTFLSEDRTRRAIASENRWGPRCPVQHRGGKPPKKREERENPGRRALGRTRATLQARCADAWSDVAWRIRKQDVKMDVVRDSASKM